MLLEIPKVLNNCEIWAYSYPPLHIEAQPSRNTNHNLCIFSFVSQTKNLPSDIKYTIRSKTEIVIELY